MAIVLSQLADWAFLPGAGIQPGVKDEENRVHTENGEYKSSRSLVKNAFGRGRLAAAPFPSKQLDCSLVNLSTVPRWILTLDAVPWLAYCIRYAYSAG